MSVDQPRLHCDARELAGSGLDAVDALAHLALFAQRMGCRLVLRHVPSDLAELIQLAGLSGPGGVVLVEAQGQTEHREHPVGVEEERHPDDPAV